jgi:hypothetical protein
MTAGSHMAHNSSRHIPPRCGVVAPNGAPGSFSDHHRTRRNNAQCEAPNRPRVMAERAGDPNAPLPRFDAGQARCHATGTGVDCGTHHHDDPMGRE